MIEIWKHMWYLETGAGHVYNLSFLSRVETWPCCRTHVERSSGLRLSSEIEQTVASTMRAQSTLAAQPLRPHSRTPHKSQRKPKGRYHMHRNARPGEVVGSETANDSYDCRTNGLDDIVLVIVEKVVMTWSRA
jgi:hypothetical protein